MLAKRSYSLFQTLNWSRDLILKPLIWSALVVVLHDLVDLPGLSMPWLPISSVAVAVAFYLGFKNSQSYDRTWEARKIWGGIVNSSRAWAYGVRDLVGQTYDGHAHVDEAEVQALRRALVRRHVGWLDALRHQLRKVEAWEHQGPYFERFRNALSVERNEKLAEVLEPHLGPEATGRVVSAINPALHVIAEQSRQLSELRRRKLLDGFSHIKLQNLLDELIALQGKAERIKKFPLPRQYATVNHIFAHLFCLLVPFGLLKEFEGSSPAMIWAVIPFSTIVGWVFLTMDRIGDWTENPFEGLSNDVPITSMSRAIERDIKQVIGDGPLPEARALIGDHQM